MKKLVGQEVDIKTVAAHIARRVEDGDAWTSIGRDIGNIEDGFGEWYTIKIVATKESDEIDESLPVISSDLLAEGRCWVRAPVGYFDTTAQGE